MHLKTQPDKQNPNSFTVTFEECNVEMKCLSYIWGCICKAQMSKGLGVRLKMKSDQLGSFSQN